ncbi:MAG TPA: TetR family transcriptional regulator [Rhizomicrobium sp.]|jgi:AcrR family transcriptional regulator|nr:TetR family transcriptional regulator [Rhizomicrobium sp.]
MPSYSAALRPRRAPRQERGERRVASLLDAAEFVIAEHGYEAATMSEIADKAGASIGSLYQFFPSKQAIAQALRTRYKEAYDRRWLPIERDFVRLDLSEFASRLMDMAIVFMNNHPASAALLDAPRSTRIQGSMVERVANFLLVKKPRMPAKSAARIASVTVHMVRAFNQAWVEAAAQARRSLKREFHMALVCYLTSRLKQERGNGR